MPSLTDDQLAEMEQAAVELARGAGRILLGYFTGPLRVDFKSENNRNPVTDADHAADTYLRDELARRFPAHGVLTEEATDAPDTDTPVMWVIDPLDGTSNFLNGLPVFGVLIAALEGGVPVVAAIFLPSIADPEGVVLHARRGGGAHENGTTLSVRHQAPPRRMAAMPTYFVRMFSFRPHLRRGLGDVRATGCAGFELASAARGVFDYVVFNGAYVWDMAAGILLVQEAGGSVLTYDRRARAWSPFTRFSLAGEESPTQSQLRRWRRPIVAGSSDAVEVITRGIGFRSQRWRRFRQRVGDLLTFAR